MIRMAGDGGGIGAISRELPVIIAGPTASGKSALALEIAARDRRVVVNADALQVYGCWQVLTARPSLADMAGVPHHLYGHITQDADYSVGAWLREVSHILAQGQAVVIVGGTGLYLSALTEGLADIPPTPPEVRARADDIRARDGVAPLLAALDPATLARIDQQNPARVQRAWEVWMATGRGLASWQDETPAPLLPKDAAETLVMRPDTAWLNARIDARMDAMMAAGALAEVRAVLPHWAPMRPWARAIGAPELVAHLQGNLSLPDAVAAAKQATRQYAKRQRTWFRSRMGDWRAVLP